MTNFKQCSICKESKPYSEYYKKSTAKTGVRSECKECSKAKNKERRVYSKEYYKEYHKKNMTSAQAKTKVYQKAQRYKRKYNLSLAEVKELKKNNCQVCKSKTNLQIDHDHITGEVVGCLCGRCNRASGMLEENKELVLTLYNYLLLTNKTPKKENKQ